MSLFASQSGIAAFLGILLLLLIVVCAIGLYFLPTILGQRRKVVNLGSVFAINLLLGWSLIGWAIALAMALRTNPQPVTVIVQGGGVPATAPGWYPDPHGAAAHRYWNGVAWTDQTS